jgi:hypothetical protein
MLTLRLDCRCDFQQEQKQTMSCRQTFLVRCLVVYLDGLPCAVPIRPKVTTREAKKTGYEFCQAELADAENGASRAAIYAMAGAFPPELQYIVYFMGRTPNSGITQSRPEPGKSNG